MSRKRNFSQIDIHDKYNLLLQDHKNLLEHIQEMQANFNKFLNIPKIYHDDLNNINNPEKPHIEPEDQYIIDLEKALRLSTLESQQRKKFKY